MSANAFNDFLVVVRDYANRGDLTDAVIISWVRLAEEEMNETLRCNAPGLVTVVTLPVVSGLLTLPADWLEFLYVRAASSIGAPYDSGIAKGSTYQYCTPDNFWSAVGDPNHKDHGQLLYTVMGGKLYVNPTSTTGVSLEIGYFNEVHPLGIGGDDAGLSDGSTYVYRNYYSLYINLTLAMSAAYLGDDDRLPVWQANATAKIQKINESTKRAVTSGSPMRRRIRSFG